MIDQIDDTSNHYGDSARPLGRFPSAEVSKEIHEVSSMPLRLKTAQAWRLKERLRKIIAMARG